MQENLYDMKMKLRAAIEQEREYEMWAREQERKSKEELSVMNKKIKAEKKEIKKVTSDLLVTEAQIDEMKA
jgi:hypothetical protein